MKRRLYVKTFEQFIFESADTNTAINSLEKVITEKGYMSPKKVESGNFSKEDIKNLHSVLKSLGYAVGSDEEKEEYGEETINAIKKFQKNASDADIQDPDGYALSSDGLFGEKSLNVAKMILNDNSLKQELDAKKGGNETSNNTEGKIIDPTTEQEASKDVKFESFEDIKKLPGEPTENAGFTKGGWHVDEGEFKGKNFYPNNRYGSSVSKEKGSFSFQDGKLILKKDTAQPASKGNTGTTVDFDFKNSKGDSVKFSSLRNATNKWYENKDIVSKLIKNNNDKQFIIELDKLYKEKTNKDLIDFLTDVYSKSTLGGRSFDVGLNLFNIITNYIVSPSIDAKIINFAVDGIGTEDRLIKLIINKRSKQNNDYKNKIAAEYEANYGGSLVDALEDDLDIDSQDNVSLIKQIVPNYFG